MLTARIAGVWLSSLLCLCAPLCRGAAPDQGNAAHLTKQQLVGSWRLVRIEYSGPNGAIVDPYYQTGSTGIIIYDSSGWMSVHIVAPGRQAWEMPASRLSSGAQTQDAQLKAAAFDTYYTYFGTWNLDEESSMVTHHVISSLVPAETGLSYAQTVTLESGHLVFTNRSGNKGQETIRRKIWERADAK
jgi:hypothetical protein